MPPVCFFPWGLERWQKDSEAKIKKKSRSAFRRMVVVCCCTDHLPKWGSRTPLDIVRMCSHSISSPSCYSKSDNRRAALMQATGLETYEYLRHVLSSFGHLNPAACTRASTGANACASANANAGARQEEYCAMHTPRQGLNATSPPFPWRELPCSSCSRLKLQDCKHE